eukprot:TRINITY_DN15062_c0_g1_i1.p3 TRINITY_DN15062_c0_g1~~TRINITY_DN15062_c0_g1_i1.p3  ORF type:complete len:100 (-),score=8.17 TRINITY_DN15062_c0_g1_i1:202-501(-)
MFRLARVCSLWSVILFFFFNDPATTEIYTLHIVGSVRCVQETDLLLTVLQIVALQSTTVVESSVLLTDGITFSICIAFIGLPSTESGRITPKMFRPAVN